MITTYAKSIVYIALTAVMFLITALADDALSVEELLNLAVAVIGAVVVYAVPNFSTTVGRYAKTIATALTAGILLAVSFLIDGISLTEWMQIGVASLAAIGVYIVPNAVRESPVRTASVEHVAAGERAGLRVDGHRLILRVPRGLPGAESDDGDVQPSRPEPAS